jgi:MoaE-MoaD fusion protein
MEAPSGIPRRTICSRLFRLSRSGASPSWQARTPPLGRQVIVSNSSALRLKAGYSFSMQVRVLFFGVLKDVLSRDRDAVDLPDRAPVALLLDHYRKCAPHPQDIWSALAVAVNQQYVSRSHLLAEGDEVALLPPVSGGTEPPSPSCVDIVRVPIQAGPLLAQLKQGKDGAVVTFDGIVRDNTRGRRTLYLDYESYESMALTEMRSLAQEAISRFSVRDVVLVHRLGRLEVGETSVFMAVASAHRAQAFDACRWLIDTLKKTIPIWKKEYFEDGAVWADGEPFPADLNLSSGDATP